MVFKKSQLISAFDIEGSLVKLAQVSIDDTRQLYRLVTRKAESNTKDSLVKAIRSLVSDYKLNTTRVMVILPRYKLTVKNLKLPSVNPTEIEGMVSLQAAKQLPFSPDKIIWGYKILGRDDSGYSDLMLALVHRDIVDNTLSLFRQAGLDVERLALSSEALALWYTQIKKEEEKRGCISLVDIGSSVLEMEIIREGRIDFTRSIDFSPSQDIEKRLIEEIKRSLFTYEKALPGIEVEKLVLTGKRSLINREAPMLKEELGLPMAYIDVLKSYPRMEDVTLPSEEELKKEAFTASLSLGFNYDKLEINLIPQEVRLMKLSKVFKESLIISLALFLSILIGVSGMITKNFIGKKRYLASVESKLKEIKPKAEELTRLKEVTQVIKRQLDITGSCIDIIREVYSKIPPEISLTIFDYEDGSLCLLRGTSQKLSDVFKFISTLEESVYFENVKVRYATKRVIKKTEVTDFEITCQLTQISQIER